MDSSLCWSFHKYRKHYNGYLEIWLQRVTQPKALNIVFSSEETICKIVNGEEVTLWENKWITNKNLLEALDVSKLIVASAEESGELVDPEEIQLFTKKAWAY